MQTETVTPDSLHHVRLDSSGRIRLPLELRNQLGVTTGDSIVVVSDDHEIKIDSAAQALRKAQDYFADFVPDGVSLVDELIAERRAEAERE